jgi:hypothetical protein
MDAAARATRPMIGGREFVAPQPAPAPHHRHRRITGARSRLLAASRAPIGRFELGPHAVSSVKETILAGKRCKNVNNSVPS